MGKTDSFPGDPNDKTGQIRYLTEALGNKADGKTVRFWIGFLVFVAGGAWGAAVYFGGFAKNDSLEKTNARIDTLGDTVSELKAGQAVEREIRVRIEADLHWQRDQSAEIAKATGAKAIPAPHHDEEKIK